MNIDVIKNKRGCYPGLFIEVYKQISSFQVNTRNPRIKNSV